MYRLLFAFYLTVSWCNQISFGAVHEILYNEEELTGSCTSTCGELPDRTDMFDCDRISNCGYNRHGWNKGFVRCDWCSCQCTTSDNLPQKVVFDTKKIIKGETDLFGTCTGTCDASGLQFTDKFNCDQIRDCYKQRTGYIKGFVRCDYCECDCVIKVYPDSYRLENVEYKVDAVNKEKKEQVVLASITITNPKNYEVEVSRTLKFSVTTETRWNVDKGYESSITIGTSVGMSIKIFDFSTDISTTVTTSYQYSWGETKTSTIEDSVTQSFTIPANTVTDGQVRGWRYTGSVPYTADLVTIYKNGEESRSKIKGILHEVSITDLDVKFGKDKSISVKRDSLRF